MGGALVCSSGAVASGAGCSSRVGTGFAAAGSEVVLAAGAVASGEITVWAGRSEERNASESEVSMNTVAKMVVNFVIKVD